MPEKIVETPYPLVDADPHFSRVMRYMRPSDYAVWAGATGGFPSLLYLWDMADPSKTRLKTPLRLGGFLGFIGGFLMAYQRSSFRFWGWSENKAEEEKDFAELSERARKGLPLYGESDQPLWVQGAAYRNSAFSQLKFTSFPMFNFVNHPHHGTDPAKYGVKVASQEGETSEQ
ncbi:NUXM, NADH-ubiquinone oxidoreductase subunit [Auriscalpium vulgare]|uniref:NUXM, NADH-ubiquinone oxidoreductase subunit n=1 Tax=Auriscalpium vulgare TaxID=40419 RepID=A0ACB8RR83_9AGAM|nr:NUXM, NADH-ubiquinone oxidoreductase subunit [Auriscalpium vulgare]